MRKIKIFSFVIFLFLLTSCAKDEPTITELPSEAYYPGMQFADWDAFESYYMELDALKDEFEIMFETRDSGFTSFLNKAVITEDESELAIADALTFPLMAIMNEDLEFKVGGNRVYFEKGLFYEVSSDSGKSTPTDRIRVSIYSSPDDEFKKGNEDYAKLYVSVSGGTGGQSHRDFYRARYRQCGTNTQILGPSSRQMRFFQQLKSVKIGYNAQLFVETKLYWRNSENRLRYTETEERNYTYNISGTLGVEGFGPSGTPFVTENINFNRTVNCTRSRWNRQEIASAFPVSGERWEVDLNGTITHHINGDNFSNKWYAAANWSTPDTSSGGGGGGGGQPRGDDPQR